MKRQGYEMKLQTRTLKKRNISMWTAETVLK